MAVSRTGSGARSWWGRAASLVALLAGLTAWPAAAQFDTGIAVGAKAPPITVTDLEGKPVDLGQYIGKRPVLLEFWASWCDLCKELLPSLKDVERTYGDRVVRIGINITVNDSRERVRRYLERHQPPFLTLYDEQGIGSRAYDVPTTSYIVVIDASGTVVYTGTGGEQDLVAAAGKGLGK
ncbi:MAG: TlpA family protein disulfide reductase [Gemmatimonadales bacterium]